MLEAGLRVKEVSNLNLGNIDLEHMVITVIKGKGNKDRIVDISKRLGPILKWYLDNIYPLLIKDVKKEDILDLPLFISERKTRLSKTTIQYHLWKQQEAYNILLDKRFSPHGLRRLFATNLYMELCEMNYRGDPIFYIKGQLGHVFLSTTIKYTQVSQAYLSRLRFEADKQITEKLGDKDRMDNRRKDE
jgi:site-specific recombinase XerD